MYRKIIVSFVNDFSRAACSFTFAAFGDRGNEISFAPQQNRVKVYGFWGTFTQNFLFLHYLVFYDEMRHKLFYIFA